jgi:predicted DNA-binding protein YlxM (UPF0122 family)
MDKEKSILLKRNYLMFVARSELQMSDSEIAKAFNISRQLVHRILR